ncbi:YdcF family protein [Rhodococcus sp. 3Y1]
MLLASALLTQRYWLAVVLGSFSLVASYLGFLFTSFLLYSYVYGRQKYQPGMDAIVVHGAGLSGADVTPLLASRLDKAADVFRAEVREGRSPLLVVSGGKGSDEVVSEAEAMCVYLVDHGIPRESVILEDRSTTTLENPSTPGTFSVPTPRSLEWCWSPATSTSSELRRLPEASIWMRKSSVPTPPGTTCRAPFCASSPPSRWSTSGSTERSA